MARLTELCIDEARFRSDFEALAQIGASSNGGVHRPALSKAHLAARAWFRDRILAAGLEFRVDGAGNHSAFLPCGPDHAPTLLLGSHLDSVPYGGRFDGPLGVLAALETLRVVKEANLSLPVNLEAIDFTDEEGCWIGELGSGAVAGSLTEEVFHNPRGGREALLAALADAGLTESGILGAQRDPADLAAYMELHIEQGARLIKTGSDIGIVTSIVGISSAYVDFVGQADHAGTTPMDQRRDASLGASAFTLAARKVVGSFPNCTVNIGAMEFAPGAFNIVPERVTVSFEYRAPNIEQMEQLQSALLQQARSETQEFGLELQVRILDGVPPAPMTDRIQDLFVQAADSLGLSYQKMPSFAGHDGQVLAAVCPVGMIFVPSVDGASHHAREFTAWQDCVNGANVLLQAAVNFDG